MSTTTRTHYEVLGVSETADAAQIKAAYRKAARTLHPDMNGGQHLPEYLEVQEANRVLSDPELRSSYDYQLANPQAAAAVPEPVYEEEEWGAEEQVAEPAAEAQPVPQVPDEKVRFSWHRRPILVRLWLGLIAGGAAWYFFQEYRYLWRDVNDYFIWMGVLALAGVFLRKSGCAMTIIVVAFIAIFGRLWGEGKEILIAPVLALVCIGLLSAHWVTRDERRRRFPRAMSRRKAKAFFSLGEPGAETRRRGEALGENVDAMVEADQDIAKTLQRLSDIPAVRVFHDVLIPGTESFINHVVVMDGLAVAVMPSKHQGTRVWWGKDGNVVYDGVISDGSVHAALVEGLKKVSRIKTVAGLITLPSMPTGVSADNSGSPDGLALVPEMHLEDTLRRILLDGEQRMRVDRAVMRTLANRVIRA